MPSQRTGKLRLGEDQLISRAHGNSRISVEDGDIALIDELEKLSTSASAPPSATDRKAGR